MPRDAIGRVAAAPHELGDRTLWIMLDGGAAPIPALEAWVSVGGPTCADLRMVRELRRDGRGSLLARADRPPGMRAHAPPLPGGPVELASSAQIRTALQADLPPDLPSIPVGAIACPDGAYAGPLLLSLDHVLGPEGAHINVAGISGLAAKTSWISWLLLSIVRSTGPAGPGVVILNGKFGDLLALDELDPTARAGEPDLSRAADLAPGPFPACRYLLPLGQDGGPASAYRPPAHAIYGFDLREGLALLDVLLAGLDDSRHTLGALVADLDAAFAVRDQEVADVQTWKDLYSQLPLADRGVGLRWGPHLRQTVQRFVRELKRICERSTGLFCEPEVTHASIPTELSRLRAGTPLVIDIAPLSPEEQSLVVACVVREIYRLRLDPTRLDFPRRVVVFVDELSKYAPRFGALSPLAHHLVDIAERGRSIGISLIGAEQLVSSVHPRIVQNAATRAFGRTPAAALGDRAYRSLEPALRATLPHLRPGELIIEHAPLPGPVRIRFPRPVYRVPR